MGSLAAKYTFYLRKLPRTIDLSRVNLAIGGKINRLAFVYVIYHKVSYFIINTYVVYRNFTVLPSTIVAVLGLWRFLLSFELFIDKLSFWL